MAIKTPYKNWNDIVSNSGDAEYCDIEVVSVPIAQPTTDIHKRRAYIRKSTRKSLAKKKALEQGIATIKMQNQ